MSSKTVHGEVHSIQHYVIKFVSDLRQGSIQLKFSMTGQEKGDILTHVTV